MSGLRPRATSSKVAPAKTAARAASCRQSVANGNQTLDKGAALMLAEALLERPARVKLEA